MPHPSLLSKGRGESAFMCMGGLPATLVYDATGAMVRQLPVTPARILKVIKEWEAYG